MTTKRKTRQKKAITLAEFTAWLEGVEEMQPSDWTPDASQWKLIKTKLKAIVADTVVQQPQPQPYGGQTQPIAHPGLPPGVPPAPQVPSSIPDGNVVRDNSTNIPPSMKPTLTDSGDKVLQTPDVEGPYETSQFS